MMPPTSYSFNKALKTTTGMLKDINYVSVMMQKQLTPLSQCQQLQLVIIESANQNRDNPASHWYSNTFGNVYIAPDSLKRPDGAFVSAVCKMQKRMGSELNADEKVPLKCGCQKLQPLCCRQIIQQQLLILWHSCLELLMVVENVRQMKSVRNTPATVMIALIT